MSTTSEPARRDYALDGPENAAAVERGLAGADWYRCAVPRPVMKELVTRNDRRATIDTLLWLALLVGSGVVAHLTFGTWWCVPAFFVYGTLYGSVSDPRWHECGHGTAFKSQWANSLVYYPASFMDFREPVSWRWSHARHHDDTIVVGRDPEIAAPRALPLWKTALDVVGIRSTAAELRKLGANVLGRLTAAERDYIPESQWRRTIWSGRIFVAVLLAVVVWSVAIGSVEPLLFIGLPSLYGRWLLVVYGLTQHAGLAEDVLDHRLNTRTVKMNALNRFLYSNMNFHIEHHMFPTVPYHALPRLHEVVKHDMPPVYDGIVAAYREVIPALRRQAKDPTYFVARPLPAAAGGPATGAGAS
jgi:fatty acid desaturase